MENIKAIFFDADDTLIDHKECERQALIYLFKNIDFKYKEEYQDIFRPLDRNLWDSVVCGNSPVPKKDIPEYRFQKFFELINIQYDDYEKSNILFKEGLSNFIATFKEADEICNYLYERGYKLYIVTNGLVSLQKPRIINSKIAKYISDIIVSEEVRAFKPDPTIFNILLDRIGLSANNVVMIGDSLEKDIYGAKNANIKGIWYNNKNKVNELGIIPDYEIKNLLDIKNIL